MTFQEWQALRRRAMSGDPDAEVSVGSFYEFGLVGRDGTVIAKKNPRRAVFWYRRAAEHGEPGAQNNLAVCLSDGHGVRKNEQEALYWLKKSLKNGNESAATNIAVIYRDRGNSRRALFWYQRAVELGDGDALLALGRSYYYGIGVRRNYHKAIEYYRKAIASKDITEFDRENAMYCLGMAYFEGHGVEHSLSLAQHWFEQANVDDDYPEAQDMLKKIHQLLS